MNRSKSIQDRITYIIRKSMRNINAAIQVYVNVTESEGTADEKKST